MSKLIALLALCLVTTQASTNVVASADDVKELYYKLLEVVGDAITEANNTCNTALDAAKEYAVEIETDAKTEIQGILDSFQAQFDEINQKAKDAGIDITACRKYEVQFTQLPDTLMDTIVACVNNQITAAQTDINDAMTRAMTIQQDFYNIEQEIDDCGSGFSSIVCLAELSVKIGTDTIEGPSKIKSDADATVVIIENAWDEIKKCATDAVDSVPSQAGKIAEDFAVCAAIP